MGCQFCDDHHDESEAHCSFCGKHRSHVARVIAGPDRVFICNECVDLCVDILGETLVSRPDGAA